MSHFSVLCVGEGWKERLERYRELDLTDEEMRKDPRAKFEARFKSVKAAVAHAMKSIRSREKGSFTFDEGTRERYEELFRKKAFEEIVRSYFGCSIEGGKVGQWHNPDGKWD